MKHTVSNHGSIDFLVNNGGGQFMSPLADVRKKGWNAVMDTNLNGTYYCLKHGKMRSVCALSKQQCHAAAQIYWSDAMY